MIGKFLKWCESTGTRTQLKKRQLLLLGGVGCVLSLGLIFIFNAASPSEEGPQKQKPQKVKYDGLGNAIPREEVWVNRMEEKADSMRNSQEGLKSQLEAMKKQVDLLNQAMQKLGTAQETPASSSEAEVGTALPPSSPILKPGEPLKPLIQQQSFPSSSSLAPDMNEGRREGALLPPNPLHQAGGEGKEGYKRIGAISLNMAIPPSRSVDGFVPAGTYIRGKLISGMVVSTATSASHDPLPLFIRLTGEGVMPRGWSARLKNAQVIASCFGELSSERARCRLESISYIEPSGEIVEEKLEGWLIGEDGLEGIGGKVVDRATEVARQALISGILGGMAGFFQAQTTASIYPVSPFGQTNAMKPQDMLKGAGANGVGNALDKLAQFAIDRAEKMSPVIVINAAQNVDVYLKKGLDISKTVYRKTLSQARLSKRQQWGQRTALERAKNIEFKGDYQ